MSMKKTLAILLAAGITFGTVGCGSSDNSDHIAAILESAMQETTAASEISNQPEETDFETVQESETESETEKVNPEILGTVTENGYENSYFGFGFAVDSGWEIADEEMQSELAESAQEAAKDTKLAELGEGIEQVTLFEAFREDGKSIKIILQREENVGLYPEGKVLEQGKKEMEQNPKDLGFEELNVEIETEQILGQDKKVLYITGKVNDVSVEESECLFLRGDYMLLIVAGDFTGNSSKELLSSLYSVN